jgi:hypothetical protein
MLEGEEVRLSSSSVGTLSVDLCGAAHNSTSSGTSHATAAPPTSSTTSSADGTPSAQRSSAPTSRSSNGAPCSPAPRASPRSSIASISTVTSCSSPPTRGVRPTSSITTSRSRTIRSGRVRSGNLVDRQITTELAAVYTRARGRRPCRNLGLGNQDDKRRTSSRSSCSSTRRQRARPSIADGRELDNDFKDNDSICVLAGPSAACTSRAQVATWALTLSIRRPELSELTPRRRHFLSSDVLPLRS